MKASLVVAASLLLLMFFSCKKPPIPPPDPEGELIAKGRQLFFNETFGGNGRTCGTCHPAENNFTLDPAFIANLPPNDPLFVAEFIPELESNFENPRLMREFAMIKENLDGFSSLDSIFTMRGIPHTLGLRTTVASPDGPRTGWSGDGAPGDGSLRSFAVGAVIQHFTKTLNRIPDVDFRLPTNDELDALEAFQLSLGQQEELSLPLALKGIVASRGQELFLDSTAGKCNLCHLNAGANSGDRGNANFNTGVENLPDQPARLTGELVPFDNGFGAPGDSTFNAPSLIEAASTGPFFHNNSIETIEGAVAFYDGESFNNSPSGRFLGGVELDGTQIVEIAAFLRVINTLENIRQIRELLEGSLMPPSPRREPPSRLLELALRKTDDAIKVLAAGGLRPTAVGHLKHVRDLTIEALKGHQMEKRVKEALRELEHARGDIIV